MVVGPRWAALWGWSPLVVLEAGNAAHVNVLAAFLITAAVATTTTRRPRVAAILLGAAANVKLLPLLLLPAFAGRKPAVAIGTYIPTLLAAGTLVLSFPPGYLTQEGFDDGSSRSAILALLLPPEASQVAAAVLAALAFHRTKHEPIAITWLLVARRRTPRRHPTYRWHGLP